MAYYKYQIVLLALQDRGLLQISNRTGSRAGSALMCTGRRLITNLKPLVDVGNHKILLLQKYGTAGGEKNENLARLWCRMLFESSVPRPYYRISAAASRPRFFPYYRNFTILLS